MWKILTIGRKLYGVKPVDPLTFVSMGFLFLAVAAAAFMIPARRALRIDPVTALQE